MRRAGGTPTRGSDAVIVPTTMCVWADDRGRIAHVNIQTGQPAAGNRDLYKGMASGSTVLAPSEVSAGSDGPNEQAVASVRNKEATKKTLHVAQQTTRLTLHSRRKIPT